MSAAWLRQLVRRHLGSSSDRRHVARLYLEALEGRMVPTVTVTLLDGGHTLQIVGDGGHDHVRIIQQDGTGNTDTLDISRYAGTVYSGGWYWPDWDYLGSYKSSDLTRIVIDLGSGADQLDWCAYSDLRYAKEIDVNMGLGEDEVHLDWGGLWPGYEIRADLQVHVAMGSNHDTLFAYFGRVRSAEVSFDADLGSGDDEARVYLMGDLSNANPQLLSGAQVALTLNGNTGNDTLRFSADSDDYGDGTFAIGGDSSLAVALYGGSNDDTIEIDVNAVVLGNVTLSAYGMTGNDTLSATIHLKSGSNGSLSANLCGNEDNDSMSCALTVEPSYRCVPRATATMDGGVGGNDLWNVLGTTANVRKSNFEGTYPVASVSG